MKKNKDTSDAGGASTRTPDPHASVDAHDPAESGPLYVITLAASIAPMPMRPPSAPALAGLAIFRSRQLEDGRERFRLHIGYFASEADAERVLPLVRGDYPFAIVALAPENSLGSLDDTGVARFSILRPVAKPPAAAPPAPAPVAGRPAATPAAPRTQPAPVAPPRAQPALALVKPAPAAAAPPAARPAPRAPAPRPVTTTAPAVAAAPAARAPVPSPVRPPTFNGHAAPPPPAAAPAPPPVVADAEPARETQHYAVQLVWNQGPIDLDKIPVLAIFTGYLLYAVESEPGPRRFYGVRLGFYADALSARLVAQYVRSEFKGVSVVPVSQREMTRASTAAIRLSASRRAMSSSITRSRWPSSALAVDSANLRRAFTPGVS